MEIGGNSLSAVPYSGRNQGSVGIILPSVYTFATLPNAAGWPFGIMAYTSDQGWYYINASGVWTSLSSGTNQVFLFNQRISATLPTGVTADWSPTGYVPGTTNCILVTAAAGAFLDSIVNPGVDGFPLLLINVGTNAFGIDNNATGTAGNKFLTPGLTTGSLGPGYKDLLVYSNGQWCA